MPGVRHHDRVTTRTAKLTTRERGAVGGGSALLLRERRHRRGRERERERERQTHVVSLQRRTRKNVE